MTKEFTAKPFSNIRQTIEQAQLIARASNSAVTVNFNEVHFSVGPDTPLQTAIDTYMEAQRKMFKTEQQLKQNTK